MGLRVNILVDEKKRNNFKKFELVSVRAHMPRQYERRLNTANSATRTGVSQSKHRNEENLWLVCQFAAQTKLILCFS